MNTSIVVFSFILSSVIFIYFGKKNLEKPIKIQHNLDPHAWWYVHIIVYFISIELMMWTDILFFKFEEIKEMPLGIKGLVCLFIQNGGLIVFIMIISSCIYNYYIKVSEFNLFVERHQWIKKTFFSFVCISLAIIYILEIVKSNNKVNILSEEYKLVAVWMIVFIQIWIGFGMKSYGLVQIVDSLRSGIKKIKDKEERQYLCLCLISMILIPVLLIIFFVVYDKIPEAISIIFLSILRGISFGAVFMILFILGWNLKYRPNKYISIKKCNKLFSSAKEEFSIGYFMGVKYEVAKRKDEFIFHIYRKTIELDKGVFSKEYKDTLYEAFDEYTQKYQLEKNSEKEIKKLVEDRLESINQKREDVLKEGWDIVYKLSKEKEEKKNREIN